MLREQFKSYIELRRSLGNKLKDTERQLGLFVDYLEKRGEKYITNQNASAWSNMSSSSYAKDIRMLRVIQLAKYLHLEDNRHQIPSRELFKHKYERPLPYIYSKKEINLILSSFKKIRRQPNANPYRPEIFITLIGLLACTGMRISEALELKCDDIKEGGILHIQDTKFGKSRYVPLHPSALVELEKYLVLRNKISTNHNYLFTGMHGIKLYPKAVQWRFLATIRELGIGKGRKQTPRIHDLRHTFATRALEKCSNNRDLIAKHFVALSTYLGHVDIKSTYWYLEATPALMKKLSIDAESFFLKGDKV
ncbi:MAG: tyrosine-type recombinase/integrase [Bacteriovoracaceae bacterium]|jgi:integrase|nr:tyrosine-type recombinase/integrase [Bacteriovoracaceae bacterium]